MLLSQEPICVTSYNSTGLGLGTIKFIDTLLLFSNILCLQEHFLQDAGDKKHSNTKKLRKAFPNHDMYIKPAYKPDTGVCRGRAKGGLATLWSPGLTKYVSKINCDNFRILATKFSFPSATILIINTYFPCDPRVNEFDDSELLKLLADITNTINSAACHSVLIAGDLNCHFSRNSTFTRTVHGYFEDLNLTIFWENPSDKIQAVDFTHQSASNNIRSISTIDHLVSNHQVILATKEAGVLHHPENTSNHSPVFVKLDVGSLRVDVEEVVPLPRTSWAKASEEAKIKYKAEIASKLDNLQVPECIDCMNLHCQVHADMIADYTTSVLECIEAAARESLPVSGGCKRGTRKVASRVPGWKEFVQPFYEESKFWHSLWVSAGKPAQGQLLLLMRQSKHQYKYALRRVQRASNKIQDDKFANELLKGGVNIFQEIKKFRGKITTCSSTIEVGATNIANHFATIYSKLYNQGDVWDEINDLKEQLDKEITIREQYEVQRVTEAVVIQGLKLMKSGKSDSIFDFQSDCLIEGPPQLVSHLTNMIRLFMSHGFVPDLILVCTLLPLAKDSLGDLTASDNYRAIAACSQVLKLLDIVILILEGEKLGCDQLQFGFEPKSSTTMCSWLATSVIEHYNKQGRVVYSCFMDLSKAFDMVEWVELFRVLKAKKVSPVFLRVLLQVYSNQSCNVKWNESLSMCFKVSNGVRQGAVSSPLLFSLYIDKLFTVLRESGFGCRLNNQFYGCLGYADDLLILSASRSGLQTMIDKCSEFMNQKSLKFSTNANPEKSKTKCVIFSKRARDRVNVAPIKLNGDDLPWVDEVKHLGNLLECNNSMRRDIAVKRGRFIGKLNSLSQEFHFVSPAIFTKLLNIYAVSFYGSGLWDLFSSDCERLYRAWNVAIRQAWRIPNTTHRYLIESISESLQPKVMLASRYITFVKSLLTSPKYPVRVLAQLCSTDYRTLVGRSLSRISRECNQDIFDPCKLASSEVKRKMRYFPVPPGQSWRVPILCELLKNEFEIPGFEKEELNEMLTYICTS